MRLKRWLIFVKFFAIGIVLRSIVFAVFCAKRRLFDPRTVADYGDLLPRKNLRSYATPGFDEIDQTTRRLENEVKLTECSMTTCFNFTRCRGKPFKVHIYPSADLESLLTSATDSATNNNYAKILSSIIRSGYYTADPSEACLFVVAYDTLDRDLLSADYVKNLHTKFASLPPTLWNNGENHLVFNLYPGTWPDYDVTDMGIETGKAMLVKASFSIQHFRPNFDISLPLFHRTLPLTASEADDGLFRPVVSSGIYGSDQKRRRYLFSFKGKRYVFGIGSETRNSLYHLHDGGRESVVVTTCRHGKNWRQVKDERCDDDNDAYDRWGSYEWLLSHSDYCLVPRGRRLGSYRFLESLQYGCVPTILSNEWELPFSEIVTWTEAAVMADERLLSMVPDSLQEISAAKTFVLRQQAKRLSNMYFSSVDRIVTTTLEIIKRRLQPWIESPLDKENFEAPSKPTSVSPFFHAFIILATKRNPVSSKKLVDAVASSAFCSKITILCFECAISKGDWPCPVSIAQLGQQDDLPELPGMRDDGESGAIFWIDASESVVSFSTDEIDFAMQVWRWFPDRLVGFFARRHQSDGHISSKLFNDFTFLTGAAVVYHKSYNEQLNENLRSAVVSEKRLLCFDRILNHLALTKAKRPIKLTSKHQFGQTGVDSVSNEDCFGSNWNSTIDLNMTPTRVRFDPLLYKDPVSNLRKKYRQMEMNNP